VGIFEEVSSTCVDMEESLRIISLPLLSWAVTILRTGDSVVRDCDMVFLDKIEGVDGVMGSKNERLERQIQLTYIPSKAKPEGHPGQRTRKKR